MYVMALNKCPRRFAQNPLYGEVENPVFNLFQSHLNDPIQNMISIHNRDFAQ